MVVTVSVVFSKIPKKNDDVIMCAPGGRPFPFASSRGISNARTTPSTGSSPPASVTRSPPQWHALLRAQCTRRIAENEPPPVHAQDRRKRAPALDKRVVSDDVWRIFRNPPGSSSGAPNKQVLLSPSNIAIRLRGPEHDTGRVRELCCCSLYHRSTVYPKIRPVATPQPLWKPQPRKNQLFF